MIAEPLTQCRVPETSFASHEVRSLHLVDIENLVGSTLLTEADVLATATTYAAVAAIARHDLVVLASSHFTAPAAWFGWPNARRVLQSGPDGADLALIRVIDTENVAVRFDRVVIASGDGMFAEPAARLQAAGVSVTVVARPTSLSRHLRFAVRDVRYLTLEPVIGPGLALRKAA
jgi:hypothetical protein